MSLFVVTSSVAACVAWRMACHLLLLRLRLPLALARRTACPPPPRYSCSFSFAAAWRDTVQVETTHDDDTDNNEVGHDHRDELGADGYSGPKPTVEQRALCSRAGRHNPHNVERSDQRLCQQRCRSQRHRRSKAHLTIREAALAVDTFLRMIVYVSASYPALIHFAGLKVFKE